VQLSHNIAYKLQQTVANQSIPQLAWPEFFSGFSGNSSPICPHLFPAAGAAAPGK